MKHLWFIRNPHASLSPNEGVQWLCREVDQTLTGTRTGNNSIGITAGLIEAVLICGGFFRFGRWLVSCFRNNRYNPLFFASPYPFNRPIRPNKKIRKIAQVQNAMGAAVSRCDDAQRREHDMQRSERDYAASPDEAFLDSRTRSQAAQTSSTEIDSIGPHSDFLA